jgi:hypothetical protein
VGQTRLHCEILKSLNLYVVAPTFQTYIVQFKSTMSGPSDKARFYLEQAVPQLQEFKEKKIFSEVRELPALRILSYNF